MRACEISLPVTLRMPLLNRSVVVVKMISPIWSTDSFSFLMGVFYSPVQLVANSVNSSSDRQDMRRTGRSYQSPSPFGPSKLRRLFRTVAASVDDETPCRRLKASTTTATSTGFEGRSAVLVKGPSVSVSSLSRGMAATIDECRSLSIIAALIEK